MVCRSGYPWYRPSYVYVHFKQMSGKNKIQKIKKAEYFYVYRASFLIRYVTQYGPRYTRHGEKLSGFGTGRELASANRVSGAVSKLTWSPRGVEKYAQARNTCWRCFNGFRLSAIDINVRVDLLKYWQAFRLHHLQIVGS